MRKLKNCIIVDDEPIARSIVANYLREIPYMKLVTECKDAFEAMEVLQEQSIDLLILDINMPKLSGLGMLRSMKAPPEVIITSAYPDYALEGFELSVTDYLLKPFSFERFVQAIGKTRKEKITQEVPEKSSNQIEYLFVKADQKLMKVSLQEIRFVEAYGNYIKIHLENNLIISKQTLTQFEEQLPKDHFVRTHKSYIINLLYINYIEGNQLVISSKSLPVGKAYRNNLAAKIK